MPGVPFTWVSMGVVTVCSTVWASAARNWLAMVTVGGEISGYWLTGKLKSANRPANTMTIDITMAVTGLLINVSAIINVFGYILFSEITNPILFFISSLSNPLQWPRRRHPSVSERHPSRFAGSVPNHLLQPPYL